MPASGARPSPPSMPTNASNNTSSPVRRPALGRRAISSHAVVTTRPSTPKELSHSHTQKAPIHKPRPHVVGGGHRTHSRNPSFGKGLSKLQRLTSTEGHSRIQHQRKKSAPVTPAGSPRGSHHVHWGGSADKAEGSSIKKTYSSPALRRHTSGGVPTKKSLITSRPHSCSGKKKTVGFELADSDYEGEWEDTTQSPESTRRDSIQLGKEGTENAAVLVDPLTFVKRPYPQIPRATSLPEPSSVALAHEKLSQGEDNQPTSETEEQRVELDRPSEHGDIATQLLSPSHSTKAPPAMSSVSAMVRPVAVDAVSRNASLSNMAAAHDASKRTVLPSSNPTLEHTPKNSVQGTSSSMEGGVSRFIVNGKPMSRTDSDPNTPSSFLPHYRPQTPPSPNATTASAKANKTSPPSRLRGAEPHSRTQQKLWLQRTAALNTSPPDAHGGSTNVSPAAMDPAFRAAANGRPGPGPYDPVRRAVNGSIRVGVTAHDNEAKHVRKAYEKTALELAVVQRFQSPTEESFDRLSSILKRLKGPDPSPEQGPALSKPVKSAPALMLLPSAAQKESHVLNALESSRANNTRTPASQTYSQDSDDLANSGDSADIMQRPKSQHPSQRILSTSDEIPNGHAAAGEELEHHSLPAESELMIRRLWESREVATFG